MVKNDIGVVHGVAGEYVVGDEGHVNSALEGAKGAQRIVLGDDQTRPREGAPPDRDGLIILPFHRQPIGHLVNERIRARAADQDQVRLLAVGLRHRGVRRHPDRGELRKAVADHLTPVGRLPLRLLFPALTVISILFLIKFALDIKRAGISIHLYGANHQRVCEMLRANA